MDWITPTFVLGGLIAAAVPLLVLYIIYSLDLYQSGAFPRILASFAWGALVFPIAVAVNSWFITNVEGITDANFARFVSPPVEELLKPLVLVAFIFIQRLIRRPLFTYFVDGAIYGFAVGIGFAIVENFSYITYTPDAALGIAIGRVISTNLIHAAASGMVGIAVGLANFKRFSGGVVLYAGFLLIAISLHLGFNNLVVGLASEPLILAYAASAGALAIALIVYAIRRGLREERAWIEETLGMADRVTAGEAAVVHQMGDLKQLLAQTPIPETFPDKISQIEDFLVLQAQLGIKRKTLEKLTDARMIEGVQREMDDIRRKMDEARREVGYGAMIYVRTIFPEEGGSLWGSLQAVVEQEEDRGFSAVDMMEELPRLQRRIMRALMRVQGQAMTYAEIEAALLDNMPELTGEELRKALEGLVAERWLIMVGEQNVVYRANLGRRRARTLTQDIWATLDTLTAEAGTSGDAEN